MDAIEKVLSIEFLCGDQSGPHYHDIFVPSLFFQQYNLLQCHSQFTLDFNQLVKADIIHFQRQYAPESFIVMQQLQRMGKPCIFLCDDNVWEIPEGNPARGTYQQADIINRYQIIMAQANAVTTSTPHLVELCTQFNPKVYLFRNLVDPRIADMAAPGRDNPREIRVGWTGTPHHHDDIQLVDSACLKLLYKYPHIKLVFIGYCPPSMYTKYPEGRYEYYNFVPVDAWYPAFANLDIDIGLVPLTDHPFNWSKTCRKFQEYSILHTPTVASPVGNYNNLPPEVLVRIPGNTEEDWIKGISYLIENPNVRTELGQRAFDYIMTTHDINRFIGERAAVYYKVYQDVTKTKIKLPEMVQEFITSL